MTKQIAGFETNRMNINKISTELKGSMSQRGADMAAVIDSKTRRIFAWAALISGMLTGVALLTMGIAEIIMALKQ